MEEREQRDNRSHPGDRRPGAARLYLLVSISYLLIALVMTFPLVLQFPSHVAGGGSDDQMFLWNLWWVKHALVDLGRNPLYTDYIMYPYTTTLTFHTLVPLNGLLSIPLQYFLGLVTIQNLFLLSSFVLSGLGAFLLADYFVRDKRAAFVAGVIFAFCPYKMAHLSHMNLAMTQWMPFYLLFLFKAFARRDGWRRHAVAAGVFLGFTFLSSYNYFLMLIMVTVLFLCFDAVRNRRRPSWAAGRLAGVLAGSLPLVVPVLVYAVRDMVAAGRLPTREMEPKYAADLLGFLSPSPHNPLLGGLSYTEALSAGIPEGTVYMGISVLVLALLGWLWRRREAAFWGLGFLVFLVLSLGPYLHVLGRATKIPLPFYLVTSLPLMGAMRVPSRITVISMLCLAVLAAFGVKRLTGVSRSFGILVAVLILVEYSIFPIQTYDSTVPPVYQSIAMDADAESVLELPFFAEDAIGAVGQDFRPVMHFQSVHGKRIFSGFVARLFHLEHRLHSYLNLPLFRSIVMLQKDGKSPPSVLESDTRAAPAVADLFGIDYVVVHKTGDTGEAHEFVRQALRLEKISEDGARTAYRVVRDRREEVRIDAGTPDSGPHLFRWWINLLEHDGTTYAWSAGEASVMLLNLREAGDRLLSWRARPGGEYVGKRVRVLLNGYPVGEVVMADGWKTYEVALPGERIKDGLDRVIFVNEDLPAVDVPDAAHKPAASQPVFDWEQDQRKFAGSRLAVAYDYFEVTGK
jgi:hypothetical protein